MSDVTPVCGRCSKWPCLCGRAMAPQSPQGVAGTNAPPAPSNAHYEPTSREEAARAEARRREHIAVLQHDVDALEAHLRARRAELAALREGR